MAHLFKRLAPFTGTLANALIHNWMITVRRRLPGPKIGLAVDLSHEPVGFDLDLYKEYGFIQTKSVGIIADQGYGKTFLMYILLVFATAADMGKRSRSIVLNSLKRNKDTGRPETAPLIEDILGSTVRDPNNMGLNFLSRAVGMTYNEQLTLLIHLVNLALDKVDGVTSAMRSVLKQVLKVARADTSVDPSIRRLCELLDEYVPEGLRDSDTSTAGLKARNPEVFEQAALDLLLALEMFMEDEFLGMFDDKYSSEADIDAFFAQRGISIDLKVLTSRARGALAIVWNAILKSAATGTDEDPKSPPKFPGRIPAAVGVDEAYSDWENPVVAESLYRKSKTQREDETKLFYCFHRLRDLQDAIVDPTALKRASNSINEIEIWFIGRQGTDQAVKSIAEFLGDRVPKYVLDSLQGLKKGFFWMLVPGQSPLLVMVIGNEIAIEKFNTNTAHRELLERYYATGDPRYYSKYLDLTTPEDEPDPPTTKEVNNANTSEEMAEAR